MLIITNKCIYLHITNSQTQKTNAMKTTNAQTTKAIFSQEVMLNSNFKNEVRLFICWESESEYELTAYCNNQKFKSITNKIEIAHIALNSLHEKQQECAEYLVNEVRLNNILEFKF